MFKPSVGYVLMAGVLSFAFINAASAEPFNADLSRQYMSGDKAAYLAGVHTKKGLDCAACHTTNVISDSETEINKQCAICHGSLEQMGTKTSSQTPNPHKSHIGQMQCTACHSGHVPSVAYCTNCHDFPTLNKMKQGVSRLKAKFTDDLSKYEELKPVKIEKTDLLIVGSGAAGFTASMAAREAGVKNLIMIEKMAVPGGNSQLAAGGMNAAGTKFQKQAGIEDNPQLMFDDTMKGGKNVSNPDLVRVLADKSNESIEWLDKHGATLSHVGQGGGSSAARMHGPADGAFVGPYLSKFFRDEAAKSNLDLRLNTKLVKLIKGTNGEITGALVKGKHTGIYQIDAKAVILATGGIGANPELIQKLRPDISPEVKTSNQPGSQGDGIILGENVGAAVVDAKEIQLNPTLLVGSPVIVSETVRGAGAVFVNKEGKRFISELTTRDKTSAAVSKQTGGVAYEIFDQKVRDKVKQTGAAFELGLAKEGRNVGELGKNDGIGPKNLEATIAQYNKYAVAGNDPEFCRPKISANVDTPKFYAIEVTPAIHYYMGGLKINPQAKVIDKNGKVIEGLFAAGEVTGGVHGKNRLGGNSISETITFGRISGEEAAKRIAHN